MIISETPENQLNPITPPSPKAINEEIRQRAYNIYLQLGLSSGSPEENWLRAEREIKGKYGIL